MAEIEMDIDTCAVPAIDGQADDDLIDYDDELVGQDEATATTLGESDALDSGVVADEGHDASGSVSGGANESYDQQDIDGQQKSNDTETPHDVLEGEPTDEQAGYMPSEDHPVDLEHEPQHDVPEQSSEAQANEEDDIHGIDFGYDGEHEAEDAQLEKLDTWSGNDEEYESHQDHDQEKAQEGSQYGEDDAVQPNHGPEPSATIIPDQDDEDVPRNDQPAGETHQDSFEEDEITWDEEDKVEEKLEAAQTSPYQNAGQDAAAQDDTEFGEAEGLALDKLEEHVSSPVDQESFNSGEAEFPAITVQYKGEEFPLFSLSSEGFFSEVSVLDDSIEALLVGFRSELVNEIASEEELVFQVDELGLEFAESYPRDSLSHITLRQILEIFDLLVKNQDPACSRTLYTFLFTKPSTSKRFESLVESAAAGKGLDEVMHLFESPMPHGTDITEAAEAADSYHELDEYEGTGDASAADAANNAAADDMHVYTESLGSPIGHDDEGVEEFEGNAAEYEQELDEDLNQVDFGQTDEKPSNEAMGQTPASSEANATAEDQSKAVLAAKVDNLAEDSDFDINEGFTSGHQLQTDTLETTTARTSTTNTVNNDELALETSGVAALDVVEDQINETNGRPEADDMAEIDWREEPEEEYVSNASPSATKRARTDDEFGMADEKDAKRQRS